MSQFFDRQEVNISIMEKLATACRAAWLKAVYISNCVWLSSETMTQLVLTFLYIAGVYWMGGGNITFSSLPAARTVVSFLVLQILIFKSRSRVCSPTT